jgi:hypothetical protein
MKNRAFVLLMSGLVAGALILFNAGCNKDDNNAGTASLKIRMSNTVTASRAYEAINIDLLKISINASTDSGSTSGWTDLETNQGIYDLLAYTSGNDTILAFDTVLQVQAISQIRLLLGDNNTIIDNGVTYDLDTPSAQTSGLKLAVNTTLQPGYAYIIQLDFDPYQSVVKTGNGKYKLSPVIHTQVIQVKK